MSNISVQLPDGSIVTAEKLGDAIALAMGWDSRQQYVDCDDAVLIAYRED